MKEERKQFNREEKEFILSKSNRRCGHCGKEIEIENMTIEHVIPISQGGGNNLENIVALCEDCNQDKGSIIVDPVVYYGYVDSKYVIELSKLFDAYVASAKTVNRRNLLCVDLFKSDEDLLRKWKLNTISALPKIGSSVVGIGLRVSMSKIAEESRSLTVHRAVYKDLDELYQYYLSDTRRTLGHYSTIKKEVKEAITAMYIGGSIYYVRDKYGDIVGSFGMGVGLVGGLYVMNFVNLSVKHMKHSGIMRDIIIDDVAARVCDNANLKCIPMLFETVKPLSSKRLPINELMDIIADYDKMCYVEDDPDMLCIVRVLASDALTHSEMEKEYKICTQPDSDCQLWLKDVYRWYKRGVRGY